MNDCIFCNALPDIFIENGRYSPIFLENDLAIAAWSTHPVNPGHAIIITRRHISDFFETTPEERVAIFDLLDKTKDIVDKQNKPDAYNIGVNCGTASGQTVMHLHVHLIPRYVGDVPNPRGGVRNVIPDRGNY